MADEVDLSALDLLTVPEVALRLRVSEATVWRLVRDGDLESVKVGRSRRIAPESIVAYKNRLLLEAAEKRAAKAAGTDAA